MREKKEKKMGEKRSKEGEYHQYHQHLFYWTWVRFLSTLTPISRSLTIQNPFSET